MVPKLNNETSAVAAQFTREIFIVNLPLWFAMASFTV
jgi:hypothetical protein